MIRLAILDQIEDECDQELFARAKAEYEADPVTVAHQELMAEYGLDG